MLSLGQVFEDYVIDDELGRGGSATVYRAHDAASGQSVALKVLSDDHRAPDASMRLQREFDFAQELSHPHVVSVYRRGEEWLAMKLVGCGNTVATLDRLDDRLAAAEQIADALDYVHWRGIVHCDVKPSNVLVHEDFSHEGAMLTDFGVAYAVSGDHQRLQPLVASLPYVAPEMLRGRAPSAATDEYALACTAVELVTGSPPFVAGTPAALVDAQLYEPPPYLSRKFAWLPRGFDGVIGKAMAKDAELRYPTCAEFVASLVRLFRR